MAPIEISEIMVRLEAATKKLEQIAFNSSNPAVDSSSKAAAVEYLDAFQTILEQVDSFSLIGKQIGGLAFEQSALVKKAFDAHFEFLKAASKQPKPANLQSALQPMFAETQTLISQVTQLKEANRSSKQFNLLATVAEGIAFLGWPFMEPKVVPFINEMKDSSQFYCNRVIKELKESDKTSCDFSTKWIAIVVSVADYVKKYHTTGVTWSKTTASGATSAACTGATTAAPACCVSGTAAACSASGTASASTASGATAAAPKKPALNVFGELNKGEGITSALKKVEKSQMTHKNPELRSTSVVKATESQVKATVKGPARLELEGNKWIIENQVSNSSIVLDQVELKHTIYVFNCVNCTIQVKGKVNAITLDDCKKTNLVLDSVVSTVDVVNCKSIQLQVLNKTPTISIDKTDGIQLFLSKDCLDVEILTSKSSEMNVSIPGKTADDDFVERAICEQFKTKVSGSGLVTVPVEHKA